MSKHDSIVKQMEFVSAGMGEVNERREENALREWLEGYEGDYTAELQAEWIEWVAENEPQYDESYD